MPPKGVPFLVAGTLAAFSAPAQATNVPGPGFVMLRIGDGTSAPIPVDISSDGRLRGDFVYALCDGSMMPSPDTGRFAFTGVVDPSIEASFTFTDFVTHPEVSASFTIPILSIPGQADARLGGALTLPEARGVPGASTPVTGETNFVTGGTALTLGVPYDVLGVGAGPVVQQSLPLPASVLLLAAGMLAPAGIGQRLRRT